MPLLKAGTTYGAIEVSSWQYQHQTKLALLLDKAFISTVNPHPMTAAVPCR